MNNNLEDKSIDDLKSMLLKVSEEKKAIEIKIKELEYSPECKFGDHTEVIIKINKKRNRVDVRCIPHNTTLTSEEAESELDYIVNHLLKLKDGILPF